jgi:hypothetical protein
MVHRALTTEAAEQGVSINRLVSLLSWRFNKMTPISCVGISTPKQVPVNE